MVCFDYMFWRACDFAQLIVTHYVFRASRFYQVLLSWTAKPCQLLLSLCVCNHGRKFCVVHKV